MKILQIYELGPLDQKVYNGIDVAILETSRELSRLGHEVTILTGKGLGRGDIEGIEILQVDFLGAMKRTWSPTNLSLARQLFFPLAVLGRKLGGFDIYHGHIYVSGLIAWYLGRKHGGRVVNTLHGSYYPVWGLISHPLKARFYKAGERFLAPLLAKLCDLQIHTGEYFANNVVEWGAPREKIRVIQNGVDRRMFCPKDHLKDGCEIFTARRLVKKNGVEYLLKAMKLVLEEVECSLTIAGDGPERMRMEKLSEKLGISEKVHFLGLVPHQDIPRHLARADLAVIPSIVEASSLFLLEAMAMGKPVIASRVGDIPQILNGAGTLVEPMDERSLAREIVAVFKHGDKRMIGRKALEEVKKRSWRKVAKKIEEEYSRLCET